MTTKFEDEDKLWNAGPNAMPIFHGSIKTTTANMSTSRAHAARLQAATVALEQIRQRENQAWAVDCNSLDEVANQLSAEEKSQVMASGDPYLQPLASHLRQSTSPSRPNNFA